METTLWTFRGRTAHVYRRRASGDYRRRDRLTTPLRLKTMVEAGRIEFPAGPIGVLHEFVH